MIPVPAFAALLLAVETVVEVVDCPELTGQLQHLAGSSVFSRLAIRAAEGRLEIELWPTPAAEPIRRDIPFPETCSVAKDVIEQIWRSWLLELRIGGDVRPVTSTSSRSRDSRDTKDDEPSIEGRFQPRPVWALAEQSSGSMDSVADLRPRLPRFNLKTRPDARRLDFGLAREPAASNGIRWTPGALSLAFAGAATALSFSSDGFDPRGFAPMCFYTLSGAFLVAWLTSL